MIEIWNRFRHWLRRDALAAELDRELRFHEMMLDEEHRRRGASAVEAAQAARRVLGNRTAIREETRERWSFVWIEDLLHDARVAFRSLRKHPGFAAVAVLSLGTGIGAVTTVFSVIDSFDFRALPFKDASRLAWISEITPKDDAMCSRCPMWVAPSTLHDWIGSARAIDVIEAAGLNTIPWEHDDVIESTASTQATVGLLRLLGVQVRMGRGFIPADTIAGAEPVALVTDKFWRTRLGGAANVIGMQIRSSQSGQKPSAPLVIVGVLPRDFHFRNESPFWTPLRIDRNAARTARDLRVVAHLAPGHSFLSATAELRALTSRIAIDHPIAYSDWGVNVEPLRNMLTSSGAKNRFVLFAITVLVLFIAVLNVTGLLSTRAHARRQEFAVRSALGAGRTRLLRQLLVEGLCISITGGLIGVVLAALGIRLVPRWFSLEDSGLAFAIDSRLVAFAAVLSLVAGCATAIGPAIRATRADLGGSLRLRAGKGRHGSHAASVLVTAQVAVALSLVTAAALLSREFVAMRYLDIGFQPKGLYSASLGFRTREKGNRDSWRALANAARERVSAIPGIGAASVEHRSAMHPTVVRADSANAWLTSGASPMVMAVHPSYFKTLGTRMVSGREFNEKDQRGAPAVAIVNASAAAHLWPRRNAIGRQIFIGDSVQGEWLTVVGVTTDVERGERAEPTERHWPSVYRAFAQAPVYHAGGTFYIRVESRSAATLTAAQSELRQLTGEIGSPFKSQLDQISGKLIERKLNAVVLNLFATFGLLLAAMGIYGSVAYAATQRTNEIGIRVALGAKRRDVVVTLARRGIVTACIGVVVGMFGAFAVSRALQSLVVATSGSSMSLFVAAGVLMFGTVITATLIPAVRATRLDPVTALRAE